MNEPDIRPMSRWAFLLAHHWPEELNRCWRLEVRGRKVFICARCLGLYPIMLAVMGWQFLAPLDAGWHDWLWLFLPALPALVDWSRSRLGKQAGANLWRTATGALLGFALGRALYLHVLHPFTSPVASLLALISLWVVATELLRYRRATSPGGNRR